MIRSFRDKETETVFLRRSSRRLPDFLTRLARRKLLMLDQAADLQDLRSPPGNRLYALTGDRQGQYSLRINEQFRICFIWRDGDALEVEIVDYH